MKKKVMFEYHIFTRDGQRIDGTGEFISEWELRDFIFSNYGRCSFCYGELTN